MKKIEGAKYVDLDTGEKEPIYRKTKSLNRQGWVKIWQRNPLTTGVNTEPLSKESYIVLQYLMNVVEWGNRIVTPHEAGKVTHICERSCYRSYKEMIARGVIVRKHGGYYLSPLYCWRGTDHDYNEACRQLLDFLLPPAN